MLKSLLIKDHQINHEAITKNEGYVHNKHNPVLVIIDLNWSQKFTLGIKGEFSI